MEIFRDFEVIFSNHMTNLLFSRDFRWEAFLKEMKPSSKNPSKKQIRHVIREDNLEITEYFHIRKSEIFK